MIGRSRVYSICISLSRILIPLDATRVNRAICIIIILRTDTIIYETRIRESNMALQHVEILLLLLLLFLLPSDNAQHDLQHWSPITFPKEETSETKGNPRTKSTSLLCQLSACLLSFYFAVLAPYQYHFTNKYWLNILLSFCMMG